MAGSILNVSIRPLCLPEAPFSPGIIGAQELTVGSPTVSVMALSKRVAAGLGAALTAALTGIVVGDVYVDWQVEGKPLWSTVAENSLPLVLGAFLFGACYWAYANRDRFYVSTVTRWQYLGAVGIFAVVGWVVGLQIVQGELKPYVVVIQTTIGGAAAGTVVGVATARNQQIRREMEGERDRFEALFENASAEIADVQLEAGEPVVRAVNDSFERIFEVDGDVRGRPCFSVMEHDEETQADIRDAIETGTVVAIESTSPAGVGERHFQLRVTPYDGDCAYVIYTNVTDLKRTQQELEETVERLERSNDRLQQFAYVASHDLQEPLRMISSYVDLLGSEYRGQLDEEADEYIDYAVDGAERMKDMIDGLLDYSRVRTQGEEFAEVDADEVLSDTLRDLELLVEGSGAEVTFDDLPTVEADRNQLGQVFQNLIENAIDHAGAAPRIHVGAGRRNGDVVFSVSDDGPGIPEDQQEDIFDIFTQRDRDSDGTGMGLAICERIVSRHGGDIWVESAEGEGATFYFTIPD